MNRFAKPRALLFLVLCAALLMIIGDVVFLQGFGFLQQKDDVSALPVVDSSIFVHSEIADYESALPGPVDNGERGLNVPELEGEKYMVEERFGPPKPQREKQPENEFQLMAKMAPPPPPDPGPPLRKEGEPAKIVIIIDDMGMDRRRSNRAIELPGPLTLSFLPYAPKLEDITKNATAHGHELLIHVPMEPIDSHLDPGPIALKTGMKDSDFDEMLTKAFNSFTGYVGINNHMGSKLTQDEPAMKRVMAALKKRGLIFVDSKTIGTSVASRVAGEAGIRHADRDVFLDHLDTPESVRSSLRQLERIAIKKGYAVAIGHPKDSTLNALAAWLPGLKERGFMLVPVSKVVRQSKITTVSVPFTSVEPSSGSYYGPVQSPVPPPVSQPVPY